MGSKIHPLRIVEMLAICHCKPIVYVQKQKLSSVMKQVNFYENLKLLGVDFLDLINEKIGIFWLFLSKSERKWKDI